MGEHVHRWLVRLGKKGGADVGKTPRGKGSKWMVVVDGQGIPLGIHVTSASPAEVTLVEPTLKTIRVPRRAGGRPRQNPERLIGDRGYDSDPLRRRLRRRGVLAIIPYRAWNLRCRYDDGRHMRRFRHRWIVERTFAWLGSFRRLLIRHERLTSMYCSLFYFAAALIALRRF
jgi:transposase